MRTLPTDEEFKEQLQSFADEHGVDNMTRPMRNALYGSQLPEEEGLTEEEMGLTIPTRPQHPNNPLDPNQDADSWMDANTLDMPDLKQTNYLENYRASLGQFIDEDLSISSYLNDPTRERNNSISELIDSGEIPDHVVQSFVRSGGGDLYDQLADWSNYNLSTSFKTDSAQMEEDMRETLRNNRKANEDIFKRQGTMGAIGQFAGIGNAAMIDPINAASMLVPPLAGTKGASFLGYTLKFAGKEAAIGAAAETVIQPMVFDWKEEIDSPYSVEEAVYNIMGAAVFAGAIGGVVGGTSYGISKLRTPSVQELSDAVQGMLDKSDMLSLDPNFKVTPEISDTVGSLANLQRELKEMAKVDPFGSAVDNLKALDEAQAKLQQWGDDSSRISNELATLDEQIALMRQLNESLDSPDPEIQAAALESLMDRVKASEGATDKAIEEALDLKLASVKNEPAAKSMQPDPSAKPEVTVSEYVEQAGAKNDRIADYIECRGAG